MRSNNGLSQFASVPWLTVPLRHTLEETVSEHVAWEWQVICGADLSDRACHPCAVLSDGHFDVFTKLSVATDAVEQFTVELRGLRTLSEQAGILVPTSIGIQTVEGGALFIAEAVKAVDRGPRQWREIGEALAQIHGVTGKTCGFDTNGFFGPILQDNTPTKDWLTFYAERRLWPHLRMAIDSGNLPTTVASDVEMLLRRLPLLTGPEVEPVLLHGDAQQNNFISASAGAFAIDPAIYYGNPEIDLALVDYFEPVPQEVFDGYQEHLPIDPGFGQRRDLWRVSGYLVAVAIEGAVHLDRLTQSLKRYL